MDKLISSEQAISMIKDGDTLMIGGFLGDGTPEALIDAIVASELKDLTIIANDTAMPEVGIGKLIVAKKVKKAIVSHIGTNRETGRQMMAGELEVILTPQGTLAEQVRAGGAGLGGVLTKVGLGTLVAEGKETVIIDGETFLLEKPLRANVALVYASTSDSFGNLTYHGSTVNFNPLMATAADTVIVGTEELVHTGTFDPNAVRVSGVFVDYITKERG